VSSVEPQAVLDGVESLSVNTWTFEDGDDDRHMGPMAEEFADAFGLGDKDTIATVDAEGVALAAIQGVTERIAERDERIDELEAENERLRERLDAVEERLDVSDDDTQE
jgi:hypothetical protein